MDKSGQKKYCNFISFMYIYFLNQTTIACLVKKILNNYTYFGEKSSPQDYMPRYSVALKNCNGKITTKILKLTRIFPFFFLVCGTYCFVRTM